MTSNPRTWKLPTKDTWYYTLTSKGRNEYLWFVASNGVGTYYRTVDPLPEEFQMNCRVWGLALTAWMNDSAEQLSEISEESARRLFLFRGVHPASFYDRDRHILNVPAVHAP